MVDTSNNCPVLTVTKAELRDILGCKSWTRWREKVMTDQVLGEVLGIDRKGFNNIREFSVPQTRALAQFFQTQFNNYFKNA